ncbi:MAG: (d)CMP kinase [Candidatus Didemnitutus sp.]|nr:(d)CMP kinase [Candidatus Didemnitutus sp.]
MGPSPFIIVAIDGGAASGKSSSSRILAEQFNLLHVDTGSFYRHLTAELLRRRVPPTDAGALELTLAALEFSTQIDGRSARMLVDGAPAGDDIRSQDVNSMVSHYAAVPAVRAALLAYQRGQREVAQQHNLRGLVMEGRDIGSVIFPDATFRFFLHADPLERAKRRAAEGQTDSITERDRLDSSRKASPLTCPQGAIDIDSTSLTLDQVVAKMAALIAPALTA